MVVWSWLQTDISGELDRVAVADGVGIVVRSGAQVVWVWTAGVVTVAVDILLLLSAVIHCMVRHGVGALVIALE